MLTKQGGVIEKDESQIKSQLSQVVETLVKPFPDGQRASADLWKFAKVHDRRNYQLIRFAMAAISDYRTVTRSIRELSKRLHSANNAALLETLTPLLYRCGSLVCNRSHIPAIVHLSRTDEHGLANAAHEVLKEISSRNPEVLEAQVQEMCKDLEAQAPKSGAVDDVGSEEILKACSGFAKRLPSKLPKERKFFQALTNYALNSSSPRGAKHAVSILMASADKKEMYAQDLVRKCATKWKYGSDRFLTKLATLSQLNLLAPNEADEESDTIISIAINQVLLTNRAPVSDSGYIWSDSVDEETAAKEWALKVIVNRLRAKGGSENEADFRAHAEPVYSTLNKLVNNEGELSKKKDTPAAQKSRLRLLAAKSLLKLCASHSLCDQLLTPRDFNSIALVAQDPIPHVRAGFVNQLKKKLVQKSHLSHRWYAIPCLVAFEPNVGLRESTLTWLRSRAAFFSQQAQPQQGSNKKDPQTQTVMESLFFRLLSLLAHHPDYPTADLDVKTRAAELADFARYILFYLSAIADERNLSLIFHIAQRVKQVRDGITKSDEITENLHTLSDLAQATIRRFADIYSQQHKFGGGSGTNILQTYPGRMGIPSSIFAQMGSHREAQDAAEKNFLPDEVEDVLDQLVRSVMRAKAASLGLPQQGRKRKSDTLDANGERGGGVAKKGRRGRPVGSGSGRRSSGSATGTPAKSAKKKKKDEDDWSDDGDEDTRKLKSSPVESRRRSARGSKKRVSYADQVSEDDEEDNDVEMEGDNDKENEPEAESDSEEKEQEKQEAEEQEASETNDYPPPSPPQKQTRSKRKSDEKDTRSRKSASTATTTKTSPTNKTTGKTTTLPRRSSRR